MAQSVDLRKLKGVGEKRAALYRKLGVDTTDALLRFYPRGYIDFCSPTPIRDLPLEETCAFCGRLVSKRPPAYIRSNLQIFKAIFSDGTGEILITLFNNRYLFDALQPDTQYFFYGRITGNLLKKECSAPMVETEKSVSPLLPVYSLTAGLSNRMVISNVRAALKLLDDSTPDPLPSDLRRRQNLCGANEALRGIHFPSGQAQLSQARRRLAFEELFTLKLALRRLALREESENASPCREGDIETFYRMLPFSPTNAQRRVIDECLCDMAGSHVMNRLCQGDVGSGKTVVAAACAFRAIRSGYSACIMVPTEILATQHYASLSKMLYPLSIDVLLLTGSTKKRDREAIISRFCSGPPCLLVGTHALISNNLYSKHLGLVVTDEQHRFGVRQRGALYERGCRPHTLVMSATPIPRTLSLILYGDLSLSQIDELPPGRQKILTYRIDSSKRQRAYAFIRKHLLAGEQAYIVCPAVDESDLGLASATEFAARLSKEDFKDFSVGLIHGRMKPAEKEAVMHAFYKNEISLLISTTVIEVGIDVPGACIILIENAERFGLSQLHQLRGRVGRGKKQSYCILLSDAKGQTAEARFAAMTSTNNGFEIAAADLRLRGPGDFFGDRQHGLFDLKIVSLLNDTAVVEAVEAESSALLAVDPALQLPEHSGLFQMTEALLHRISEGSYN